MTNNSLSYVKTADKNGSFNAAENKYENGIKSSGKRTVLYFDIANIEKGSNIDSACSFIDYGVLISNLIEGRDYRGGYSFAARSEGHPEYQDVCDILKRYGIRTNREGHFDPITKAQKGVDGSMGLVAYDNAMNNGYDVIILLTGDADLLPAAMRIRDLGKEVIFAAFDGCLSRLILHSGFEVIHLDHIPMIELVDRSEDYGSSVCGVNVNE